MGEARSAKHRPASAPLGLPIDLRLLESSSELATAIVPDVLITVWRRPMTVELIQRVDAHNQQMRDLHAHYFVLSVVEPEASGHADAPTRQAMAELSKKYEDHCGGVALVIAGTSIKQTLVRMTIVTIQLLSTQRTPQAVFDNVAAASAWIGQQHPSARADELTKAVQAVRAQRVK